LSAVPCADIRALLLDIEGTTTPLEFVTEVLFPFARAHVRGFLDARAGDPEVRADLERLRAEHGEDERAGHAPPPWTEGLDGTVRYVHWLMDRDRKSTALKALQGRMWEDGYHAGALSGEMFADVPAALARWRAQGRDVAMFSSGSVRAQKLLFAHTPAGDLTGFLSGFFDTTTGPKREAASYRAVAAAMSVDARSALFLSDVTEELDAARAAGMATGLCVRSGIPPARSAHPVVTSFDEVCPAADAEAAEPRE
jgi:enolase-phosphatase E1